MIRADYHVHTDLCDGRDTPEQMAQAAYEMGLSRLGFSGHGYTSFDDDFCMSLKNELEYRRRIAALKEQYRGKMEILCGIEQDFFAGKPDFGYDYVIGSVHYVKLGENYLSVDHAEEISLNGVRKYFDSDFYALAEHFYATAAQVVEQTGADIIGHFDILTKFNEGGRYFDEEHPRYKAAWKAAADRLLAAGKPFEINVGAVSRGYRTAPYPSLSIAKYISDSGGSFILSSDSHSTEALCFQFDKWEKWAEYNGITLCKDVLFI